MSDVRCVFWFDMDVSEVDNILTAGKHCLHWTIMFAPFSDDCTKHIFFLNPFFSLDFFNRHCCRCDSNIDQTTLQRETIQQSDLVRGGRQIRTVLVPSQCRRKLHNATKMKLLNIKASLFCKIKPDVIKMLIVNNSTSNI